MAAPPDATLLVGALSRDIYTGVLNVAWHWRRLGFPFRLVTRIGRDRPERFTDFLEANGIPYLPRSIVGAGQSASIDIEILADRQPHMDHFVEGVWADFTLTRDESRLLAGASRLHAVLVEGMVAELHRLGGEGALGHLQVAADFLGFRHYTVDRFRETMAHVDVAFVGWPGRSDDPEIAGLRDVAFGGGKLVVVTFGAQSVVVFDGRRDRSELVIPVEPVPVAGTTVGCGDAFIAGFLAAFWSGADVAGAVEHGKERGATATAWFHPLPDAAYGEALRADA
jgi:fructoselysine 6-kinase